MLLNSNERIVIVMPVVDSKGEVVEKEKRISQRRKRQGQEQEKDRRMTPDRRVGERRSKNSSNK